MPLLSSRLFLPLAGLLLSSIALAGCSATAEPKKVDLAAPFSADAAVTPEWSLDITPVSSPAFVAGTALVYDGTDELRMVAVDTATGEERWSRRSSTGAVVPKWTGFSVVTTEGAGGKDLVAYLTPAELDASIDYYQHTLVVADVQTGEVIWHAPKDWVAGVWNCGLNRDVCYSTWDLASESWVSKELNVDTGQVGPVTTEMDGRPTDVIDEGVYSYTDASGTAWFGRRVDGQDLWKVEAEGLVGKDIDSAGRLRAVDTVPDSDDLLLNMTEAKTADGKTMSVDDFTLVSIDGKTGSRNWSTTGALCTGADLMVCRGAVSFSAADDDAGFDLGKGALVVAGIDASSGKDRWSKDLAGVTSLANARGQAGRGNLEDAWVYQDAKGAAILSTDGQSGRVPADDLTACKSPTRWNGPESSNPQNPVTEFQLGIVWSPCDAAGRASGESWTDGSVRAASDMPDDWKTGQKVVQTKEALLGFQIEG
ncbi:hypothetical protein BIU97_12075 [Curtobacterium sp. MCBA15_009]|uniref:PQQ-binding-like beta-propeller repeat protein n=1 Tax=Curtobacterium sp. MCBA15_009 TaxID=1898737 RepID=UPI0008DDAD7B|nr:PQQ-binding-like beta-propeller repeat protein [Curtobacterium sp. MCBA15_009]OII09273.1 hypothetical protein BIU97_12075 [Curtobacterium sp. MCBA15_009]